MTSRTLHAGNARLQVAPDFRRMTAQALQHLAFTQEASQRALGRKRHAWPVSHCQVETVPICIKTDSMLKEVISFLNQRGLSLFTRAEDPKDFTTNGVLSVFCPNGQALLRSFVEKEEPSVCFANWNRRQMRSKGAGEDWLYAVRVRGLAV